MTFQVISFELHATKRKEARPGKLHCFFVCLMQHWYYLVCYLIVRRETFVHGCQRLATVTNYRIPARTPRLAAIYDLILSWITWLAADRNGVPAWTTWLTAMHQQFVLKTDNMIGSHQRWGSQPRTHDWQVSAMGFQHGPHDWQTPDMGIRPGQFDDSRPASFAQTHASRQLTTTVCGAIWVSLPTLVSQLTHQSSILFSTRTS